MFSYDYNCWWLYNSQIERTKIVYIEENELGFRVKTSEKSYPCISYQDALDKAFAVIACMMLSGYTEVSHEFGEDATDTTVDIFDDYIFEHSR